MMNCRSEELADERRCSDYISIGDDTSRSSFGWFVYPRKEYMHVANGVLSNRDGPALVHVEFHLAREYVHYYVDGLSKEQWYKLLTESKDRMAEIRIAAKELATKLMENKSEDESNGESPELICDIENLSDFALLHMIADERTGAIKKRWYKEWADECI